MTSLIIALLVAMLLLLVGCFVIFALNIRSNKIVTDIATKDCVESDLKVMTDEKSSSREKIKAFNSLIEKNYSTVVVNNNSGDKYNDKAQTKRFCKNLTPERIEHLNSLGSSI